MKAASSVRETAVHEPKSSPLHLPPPLCFALVKVFRGQQQLLSRRDVGQSAVSMCQRHRRRTAQPLFSAGFSQTPAAPRYLHTHFHSSGQTDWLTFVPPSPQRCSPQMCVAQINIWIWKAASACVSATPRPTTAAPTNTWTRTPAGASAAP